MPQPSHVLPSRQPHVVRVLDAVDDLDRPLGALRAIEALTEMGRAGAQVELPGLNRPDLASLLCLVANDLAQVQASARQALDDARHGQPLSQPATHGDEA
jgi:hypothetical protein